MIVRSTDDFWQDVMSTIHNVMRRDDINFSSIHVICDDGSFHHNPSKGNQIPLQVNYNRYVTRLKIKVTHLFLRACLEGGREGGSRPRATALHVWRPWAGWEPGSLGAKRSSRPGSRETATPTVFWGSGSRRSLQAISAVKWPWARLQGVESNTFFFGPGWFGASPKHGPLHHMDLAGAGHSLGGGPGSLGAA
jgi:hypothetical protein